MDDELLAIVAALQVFYAERHVQPGAPASAQSRAALRWKLSGRDYGDDVGLRRSSARRKPAPARAR